MPDARPRIPCTADLDRADERLVVQQAKRGRACSRVFQSAHPYTGPVDVVEAIAFPGCSHLTVRFDVNCHTDSRSAPPALCNAAPFGGTAETRRKWRLSMGMRHAGKVELIEACHKLAARTQLHLVAVAATLAYCLNLVS